jgi:hypothetical protein
MGGEAVGRAQRANPAPHPGAYDAPYEAVGRAQRTDSQARNTRPTVLPLMNLRDTVLASWLRALVVYIGQKIGTANGLA